ncbi:MAG: hypothetical protein KJ623_03760 [Nanoarchaeota archaeon]|nr:hypothetical protein [Nanoarchaeota archaeon]MBU0963201.1 hypothetical protein [Nanoarchaeota archaeon]
MKIFLKEIEKNRKLLLKDRKKFFETNKKNFEKNIIRIIKKLDSPKGWRIYIIAGNFVSDKKIMPYDWDSWSSVFLIGATRKQRHEILAFFNRARSEFLSLPALVPLITHEMEHIKNIAKNPAHSARSAINDEIALEEEKDADKKLKNLPDEFRKEMVLESVLYCYDIGGWRIAKKIADFYHKEHKTLYAGYEDEEMTNKEYKKFLEAKRKKNMKIFIDFFK